MDCWEMGESDNNWNGAAIPDLTSPIYKVSNEEEHN